MIFIANRDCYISIAKRLTHLRSCKNDVFHLRPTKLPCTLFTKHPANRIRNITLSASVWPDNRRYAVMELKQHFIGKRLKPMYFQTFQIHPITPFPKSIRNRRKISCTICTSHFSTVPYPLTTGLPDRQPPVLLFSLSSRPLK